MDFESDLCSVSKSYTDNMADFEAPTNTINDTSAAPATTTINNIEHNFHELCRSCGKTNAELYDLFQTTSSPFSTSATTCYTHLNNCPLASSSTTAASSALSTSTSTSTSTANKPSSTSAASATFTDAASTKPSTAGITFDSLAATAKATAKGQSNMDNILQEMQIWQLLIKCNDGLPQRICAKCTAQFYMIHKFRRKCLKVQTQLRALYEEQQKFYERQQQQQEKNVTVKDATIEATSTPTPPPPASSPATTATAIAVPPEPAPLVEVSKPPAMHKPNDLVNDNYCEPQQAVVDNTNTKSSVPFEANTGNTNDFIAPSTTATAATTILLDNVETMPQKTEANEPTPTSSAPAFIDKAFEAKTREHCVVTTEEQPKLKDEKKPLLRPAVMDSKRSPPLTLQQPLEQEAKSDSGTKTAGHQTNASKKVCLDQELFLSTHIIFKSNNKQNELTQRRENDKELFKRDDDTTQVTTNTKCSNSSPPSAPALTETHESLNARPLAQSEELDLSIDCGLSKANSESSFVTKAALKAYTIPPPSSSPPPPPPPPQPTSETENRDREKPIINSEAVELKNANDNNNNTHGNIYFHRCDNRSAVLNDNTCSSTSTSNPNATPSSSCSSRYQKGKNITRRRIIKYANSHNRRPGHCYKSNAKATAAAAAAAATTKMARTIRSYGGRMIVAKKRKQRSQRDNKHKLKRRLTTTQAETSSTVSGTMRGIYPHHQQQQQEQQQQQQQNVQKEIYNKNSLQMEDEMSSTVSTTSSASTTLSASGTLPLPSTSTSASTSTSSTSSSAISSTSSHLKRATAPAAATADLVRNGAGVTSFCTNANENMNKKGCSSADRLSSNDSSTCLMWKTKAAMKANGNDMPAVEVAVTVAVAANNNGEPTSNVPPEISLPYIAPATLTGSTPSSLLWSASSPAEKAKSSKTLHQNQSINSCLKNNNKNNNNNIILVEEYHTHNKIIMSSPDNQVKDTKNKGTFLQNTKILNRNLWPEEAADQQQININNDRSDSENYTLPIVAGNAQTIECVNSANHEERETPQIVDEVQKSPVIPPTPAPPAKRSGSMKLIIQRKRGARFKCLRKDEDGETLGTPGNHKPSKPKRKRKHEPHDKLEVVSLLPSQIGDCADKRHEDPVSIENVTTDKGSEGNKLPGFNTAEDENKENPIPLANNYEFDSDSNVSVYRDPLLLRNEMLDEDTHVTDFSKTPLSLQTECSKEMYKQYKEKANLESPKKLLVRVPLTSLTQDFKRLHLTIDGQEDDAANQESVPHDQSAKESNEETPCMEQQKDLAAEQKSSPPENASGSQSDLVGFSQSTASSSSGTVDSFHPSIDIVKYIDSPLCPASSKINDFINDFQNNCIDSSEIEDSCDMIPTLGRCITQGLSDEIRDVEDTLNGIISEMHDKDMHTPSSGKREELFPHSVYSPLTEPATTPSQSFYAESPCTINSNPMSVSPFIHHNMDYNAMTPQSNHSSMGFSGSYVSGGGSTGPHTGVYSSEHFPTYNECFEESNQSELIGFQNDIPCFENIEMANELQTESNELDEPANSTDNNACVDSNPEAEATTDPVSYVDLSECSEGPDDLPAPQPTLTETSEPPVPDIQPQQISYNLPNYQQLNNTPPFQMQNINTPFIPTSTASRPQYFVTNTNQGSILITSPQLNQGRNRIDTTFKPTNNNLQFVTLGQALKGNQPQPNPLINNVTNKIGWPTTVNAATNFNQQPVLPTANGTTTYFINTNNGLYQANIPTNNMPARPVNTIFVPPNTSQTFCKTNIGNNRATIQQQPVASNPSSQYIMLLNNLNGSSQYYATAPANLNQTASPQPNIQTPTVLLHPVQSQNVQNTPSFAPTQPPSTTEPTASAHHHVPLPNTPPEPQTDAADDSAPELPKFNQQLQKHLKRHQQLLPRTSNVTQNITLICRFCHKRPKFTNNVEYSNHIINTHPAEKPYNCPHCPTHFSRRSDRQTHVAHFHGSRYQCAQCGLSFCAQRTLDFHLQKYHANLGRSHQLPHQNSSSATTTTMGPTTATTPPATYQLLQHNHQQRLVRVEDVHVQVTGENKNKRSINLTLNSDADGDVDTNTLQSQNEAEILSRTVGTQQVQQQHHHQQQQQQQQQQRGRKLCCPDCNSDNDNCNFINQNYDQSVGGGGNINAPHNPDAHNGQQYVGNAGNGGVNNHIVQHVTIPSPEQTEPDSTTTLRHFRRRQLCEMSSHFALASPSSSSSSFHTNAGNNDGGHDNININHNSPDNALAADGGGGGGSEHNASERTLRDSYNCMLCEESFTNEIALRKHHHLAHGATQSTTCSSANASTSLLCPICKQSFRMRNTLQRHMETHDAEGRPYECNICSVRFPRPSQLTLHKLTVHKFEKPNSCDECGKQFGTESGMKSHVTEHEEASRETNRSASSEASASTSSSQSQSQLSSLIYSDTVKRNTTTTISASAVQKENINLHATASGENSSASALISADTDACNNHTNNTNNNAIVSGLVT